MSLSQSENLVDEDANKNLQAKRIAENEPGTKDEEIDRKEVPVPQNNMAEFSDPAILMMKMPNRYSQEELMALRESPMAKIRPVYLDVAYDNNRGIWDPELWHYNRKSSEGPMENGSRNSDMDHRRRSGDPRERLRKEGDGIVLSPQRRSFNSGCYVPNREIQRTNRSHSPNGKNDPPHMNHREMASAVPRRIGSGRIIPWDKQEADEFGYRRDTRRDSERDERFERRSFGRDFDSNRDKDKGRNGRFERRKEDEPEWFHGGPVSQNDVIELRGFDDADKIGKKKRSAAHKRRSIDRAIAKYTEKQKSGDEGSVKNDGSQSPTLQEGGGSDDRDLSPPMDKGGAGDAPADSKVEAKPLNEQNSIDLDDILKSETFTGFITNGVGKSENSRFSRWFNTEKQSPPKQKKEESRRSSIQEDNHHFFKNLLNDEPNISIPDDSNQYFAPISPAANTGSMPGPNLTHPTNQMNLMEMLQRGKQKAPEMAQQMKNVGKLLSLEELEARMVPRTGAGGDMPPVNSNVQQKSQKSEDIESFQRMLAQVANNSHVIPQNGPIPQNQQPMSLLEMLSHSQQQDEAARLQSMMMNAGNNIPSRHDVFYQLAQDQERNKMDIQYQAQIEMLMQKINSRRTPPLADMGIAQSRELLNRPEAQAILQGLKRGDLTPQHLYQQLANPAMQPRHRELLLTILKLQGNSGGMGPSPRVLSPVPPHPLFHQQQLRVSPLPNAYCVSPILATSPNTLTVPAMHQRIPSPRELQVHTQNIMQRALIKKKLEEQQENYRKKQEMQQRGQSPAGGVSPAKNVMSPTPLNFTPTSVLRQMTADKEEGVKDSNKVKEQAKMPQGRALTGMKQAPPQAPHQQWSSQYQQVKQPGRPIVKANNNFQQPQQEQFFQQQQQQQRLFNQNQQPQQQQQRKPPGQQQYPSPNPQFQPMSNHIFNQLTQSQMRAKHQQQQQPQVRPAQQSFNQGNVNWQQMLQGQNYDNRNNMSVGRPDSQGGELSPTSNQLARWFSPELLERARKGKVPNLPNATVALHAMSLEDVERQATPAVHN